MTVFYNENDPAAAYLLRWLSGDQTIPLGHVDDRSIKELKAEDVAKHTQCHFFAGGGLWSVALDLAGWPEDLPIWTASCPCQPFSAAGKGGGTDDPRHLWPDLFRLVRQARPGVIVGEQVSGKAGYGWFDGVRADLESEGYTCGAFDFPACAVNAPHQRNRLYWVAVAGDLAESDRIDGRCGTGWENGPETGDAHDSKLVDVTSERRREGRAESEVRGGRSASTVADAPVSTLGHSGGAGLERHCGNADEGGEPSPRRQTPVTNDLQLADRNHWSDAEWIICHDGKARRTKPGLRFLVDGFPGRVDCWRVGGNAIVPQAAAEVVKALMEILDE